MTPWRHRCPQGHTSLQTRGDDRYYCQYCACEYRAGPFDAAETEFPVEGIERIETPDADDVLRSLVTATRTRRAVAARRLDGRFRSVVAHLSNLRDCGLVATLGTTGSTQWRPTAAGRQAVGESSDEQPELVADGGRPVAADDGTHDMSDSDDAVDGRDEQTTLKVGTILKKGDTKYELLEDESLGVVATEIGDRRLTDQQVPDIGDDCILPQCDGIVENVNGRRWCSEGCLEWMRTTPAQGDDCDKYGDRCDGQLDVTVNEDGSVEHDCSDCGRSGWSRRIEWREAWLPFSDRSATSDSSEATMPSGASSRDEDDQPNGLIWDREDCPEDDCDGELQQQDEFNVMCLSCEVIWSHIAFPTEHQLQTKTGQTVARKDRRVATDGGQSTDALARINGDDVILEIGCSPQWATWVIETYKNAAPGEVIQTDVLLKETDDWGVVTAATETIAEQLDGGEPTRLLEHAEYHYRIGFNADHAGNLREKLDDALAFGADAHQLELRLSYETLESLVRQFRGQIE